MQERQDRQQPACSSCCRTQSFFVFFCLRRSRSDRSRPIILFGASFFLSQSHLLSTFFRFHYRLSSLYIRLRHVRLRSTYYSRFFFSQLCTRFQLHTKKHWSLKVWSVFFLEPVYCTSVYINLPSNLSSHLFHFVFFCVAVAIVSITIHCCRLPVANPSSLGRLIRHILPPLHVRRVRQTWRARLRCTSQWKRSERVHTRALHMLFVSYHSPPSFFAFFLFCLHTGTYSAMVFLGMSLVLACWVLSSVYRYSCTDLRSDFEQQRRLQHHLGPPMADYSPQRCKGLHSHLWRCILLHCMHDWNMLLHCMHDRYITVRHPDPLCSIYVHVRVCSICVLLLCSSSDVQIFSLCRACWSMETTKTTPHVRWFTSVADANACSSVFFCFVLF